jgi:hypothetical protein
MGRDGDAATKSQRTEDRGQKRISDLGFRIADLEIHRIQEPEFRIQNIKIKI